MEGATGTSQQADQPSVTPASAQARTLLPVMERHLRIRCATPDVLAPAAKRPRLHFCRMPRLSWETNDGTGTRLVGSHSHRGWPPVPTNGLGDTRERHAGRSAGVDIAVPRCGRKSLATISACNFSEIQSFNGAPYTSITGMVVFKHYVNRPTTRQVCTLYNLVDYLIQTLTHNRRPPPPRLQPADTNYLLQRLCRLSFILPALRHVQQFWRWAFTAVFSAASPTSLVLCR